MKRSNALKLICNQLDFLDSCFQGARESFSEDELKRADVILTTLESAGMLPPEIDSGIFNRADCANYWVSEWEEEDEKK